MYRELQLQRLVNSRVVEQLGQFRGTSSQQATFIIISMQEVSRMYALLQDSVSQQPDQSAGNQLFLQSKGLAIVRLPARVLAT